MPKQGTITPQPGARPARGRRRAGETREAILDAAEALFAERGYAGATLRDVASRVGVRNPSIYNHFPSKDALYEAVLRRVMDPMLQALTDFVKRESGAYRDSRQIVERTMQLLSEHPNLPRLVQHETLAGGLRLTPLLRDSIAPIFARAYESVEAVPAADDWQSEQIPLLVLAMYHIVVGYFTIAPFYEQLGGKDLLSDAAIQQQTDFLCRVVDALFAGTGGASIKNCK